MIKCMHNITCVGIIFPFNMFYYEITRSDLIFLFITLLQTQTDLTRGANNCGADSSDLIFADINTKKCKSDESLCSVCTRCDSKEKEGFFLNQD